MTAAAKEKESQVLDVQSGLDDSQRKQVGAHQSSMPAAGQQQSETMALINVIERVAMNPEADIDKMERLLEMREKLEARQAEQAYNMAMAKAQSSMPSVGKTQTNKHTNSMYADLGGMIEAIKPIYTQYGFSVSYTTGEGAPEGYMRIIAEVSHEAGCTKRYPADLPLDVSGAQGKANKTGVQGWGSTASYGRRYLLALIFNIAIMGEDNDGNKPPAELSNKAGDWIAAVNECSTMDALEKAFKDGYKDLGKDSYGRNQLIKAKDATKHKILRGNQ